tara:strand:+ start:8340 stop:9149 length:810 start_codon:yes stop_codon:yes gene_type:complete
MNGRIPRVVKTSAIVLGHRRLGDADRIVTMVTPQYGKVDAVAKGALRPKSKLAGHVEPLTLTEVSLAHGRSLDIITQAQTLNAYLPIKSDLQKMSTAFYLLELTNRFLIEDVDARQIFELLDISLLRLSDRKKSQLVTRVFEFSLLRIIGVKPELMKCVITGEDVDADKCYWSVRQGGVIHAKASENVFDARLLESRVIRVLRAIEFLSFEEICRIKIDPELSIMLETMMIEFIQIQSELIIKSPSFMGEVRRVSTFSSLKPNENSLDG